MADFPIMETNTSEVNISDVLDAIRNAEEGEQVFGEGVNPPGGNMGGMFELTPQVPSVPQPMVVPQQPLQSQMMGVPQQQQQQQHQQQQHQQPQRSQKGPYVEIVEQPASKALRFRYECEGRSAGSIPGVNSTQENKTFPTIRIVGARRPAIVVVSCVTKDEPYRAHPHNLVGKEVCKKGVCRVKLSADNMTVSFDKLGIQCVKRKDIEEALTVREAEQVDPFSRGFEHKRQPTSIDLNAVRLAFQVFLEGSQPGKFNMRLHPVVSEPIYDKKANSDLVISKLSHCTAPVTGGMEMVLLCEKVSKEDIQVRFFEEVNGQVLWEGFGEFQPTAVHKQVAIAFRTPSYRNQDVDSPVKAFIQLRRPSDGATSEALAFMFSNERKKGLKRPRREELSFLLKLQDESTKQHSTFRTFGSSARVDFPIKKEPGDRLSPYPGPSNSPGVYYAEPPTIGASNMGLRPISSPGRTQSPMDDIYLPPMPIPHPVQPINILQPASPMLGQNILLDNNIPNELQTPYVPNTSNILSRAIQETFNMGDLENVPPNPEYNFIQLPNVDEFNNLSISDIVKGPINGDEAAGGMEESNVTDSFTRLTRNTMEDLCQLNEMYKPTRG